MPDLAIMRELAHKVPSSYQRPDGVWIHYVRQSDIGRFRKCPELHRRDMAGLVPDRDGDAAIIGTACHEGIRFVLSALVNDIEGVDTVETLIDEARAAVHVALDELWFGPTLWQVQISGPAQAHALADECFTAWCAHFLPDLIEMIDQIDGIELPFAVEAWREPKRIVYLMGTMDLRFIDGSVVDWKHPGAPYTDKGWEHQRYDNQPTHYLWASCLLADNNPLLVPDLHGELPDFTYGVVVRGKGYCEELEIKRTIGDIQFYRLEILRLIEMIESRQDRWPINPTDWHCSDKWCPAWDQCRGQYLGSDPFGLMAKVAKLTGKHSPALHVVPSEEDESDPFGESAFEGLPAGDDGTEEAVRWDKGR